MKKIFFSIILIISLCGFAPSETKWRVGKIYDGDTIGITAPNMPWVTLRLAYIDAPEKDQDYGPEAKTTLEKLLAGCDDVSFTPVDGDHYGRTVALVHACGKEVNAELVKAGAAWVYARYNKDPSMPDLEKTARAHKEGLWGLASPEQPEDWRKTHKPDYSKR